MFIVNGTEYPRFIGDLRIEHPSWKENDPLPEGWAVVEATEMPQVEENQIVEEITPVLIDGSWLQTWAIRDLTDEEILARSNAHQAITDLVNRGMPEDEARIFVQKYFVQA